MAAVSHVKPGLGEAGAHLLQSQEKQVDAKDAVSNLNIEDIEPEVGADHKQDGVRRVEAITTVWSRNMLIMMFALLWIVTFVDGLSQSVMGNLDAYVTSSFQQHGLLSIAGVVATIFGGVCSLTIAKVIDIWGRAEGFCTMIGLAVMGLVMMAACRNVETYAAAKAFNWVGHIGLLYVIIVIMADITSLRNRLIIFGLQQLPTIATVFAAPPIAERFYKTSGFRWAFCVFSIILFVACLPVGVVFLVSKSKAIRNGVYPARERGRTPWESFKHYFVEFDVVGMLLTIFGWSLLLLPFSLASRAPNGWRSGYIITMVVLSLVLIAAFAIWESCWDTYYQSYLQAVHYQDIMRSGYILNAFSLTSAFISPFVGLLVRYTGDYKWLAVGGTPFALLGTCLLRFRTPEAQAGYLVMCQLFNGISSGIWVMAAQLAIMTSINHQQVAVALAMFGLFGSIGDLVGQAIAGGIWNNLLLRRLTELLPDGARSQADKIYGSIATQLQFPAESPERAAIIAAYSDVQKRMVIAGSCFLSACLVCLFLWRNLDVRKIEQERGRQTKGTVF